MDSSLEQYNSSSLDALRFNREGFLGIYHGCMFAGKSRLLIMKLSKKQDLGLKVVYVTHGNDQRLTKGYRVPPLLKEKGSNCGISTHWSCFADAIIPFDCLMTQSLGNIYHRLLEYDVIGIDELQFFKEEVIQTTKDLVELEHKRVYVVGLDTNFKREKFGHILDLIPFCNKSKKIRAKCDRCKGTMQELRDRNLSSSAALVPASFTAKIGGDINKIEESGAQEMYIPLCRYHYIQYEKEYELKKIL